MSFEAITAINEAEEKARQMKADALAGAKAAAEVRELRAKSDEKAKQDAIELASDTENRKAAMRARADARMEKAAALIVERVVNG